MNYLERLFRQRVGYECEPTTLLAASLALSTAQFGTTIIGQRQQAKAQEAQQQALVAANNAVSGEQMAALRVQEAQSREATARENEKARLASQKAQATARVAAGEAGVEGNSVDALLQEYRMNLGQFREATTRQGQLNATATAANIEAIRTGARFQNLQINAPVVGPNYAGEALRLGQNGLGAYAAYNPSAFKKA